MPLTWYDFQGGCWEAGPPPPDWRFCVKTERGGHSQSQHHGRSGNNSSSSLTGSQFTCGSSSGYQYTLASELETIFWSVGANTQSRLYKTVRLWCRSRPKSGSSATLIMFALQCLVWRIRRHYNADPDPSRFRFGSDSISESRSRG